MLYLFWFLHQTTTHQIVCYELLRCISFDSYIKPQRIGASNGRTAGCISFDSYIKPQLTHTECGISVSCISFDSYIKPQPALETHQRCTRCISFDSYIKPQPEWNFKLISFRCISFDSYIKPQRVCCCGWFSSVVSLLIPTSNHNLITIVSPTEKLYLFWFLHQTTTLFASIPWSKRCISFDSYIKPQPRTCRASLWWVVSLLIPTSNHNPLLLSPQPFALYLFWFLHQTTTFLLTLAFLFCCISFDSYIKPQLDLVRVFLLLCCISFDSYIKPQLVGMFNTKHRSCISFDSYIKPQPVLILSRYDNVVSLLIPTSNHNRLGLKWLINKLYLFWFLHQTTTSSELKTDRFRLYLFWFLHQTTTLHLLDIGSALLYLFWFLHQTTTVVDFDVCFKSCISFDSYIKPQLYCSLVVLSWVVSLLIPTSNHNTT